MMKETAAPLQPTLTRPIANQAEAQQVIGHLSDVMDALIGVIEEETKLVRAGRLSEVPRLRAEKTNLARLYLADTARLQASHAFIAKAMPAVLRVLRERHNTFRNMLQINLTVLATAHAVSEGILRGVNAEVQRRNVPNTYTAAGQRAAPGPRHITQLAVSRSS